MPSPSSDLHIVLIEPEIPQNTGNIGRTCVGLGAHLHLVGDPAFSLSGKDIRRAGLDYWNKLKITRHKNWTAFTAQLPPSAHLLFFSTKGAVSHWEVEYRPPCYLVFGSESRGLPPSFYRTYRDKLVQIPFREEIRSLNLATAAGVAAYEAARHLNHRGQGVRPRGQVLSFDSFSRKKWQP